MWEVRWALGGEREATAEGQSVLPRPPIMSQRALPKGCVLALLRGP